MDQRERLTEGHDGSRLRPLQSSPSLAESAADLIREEILAGRFGQGQHLVEASIARQLNVSRGPVREALKLLRAEGLVTEEPRRGTFVVSLLSSDVREIYGLRAAIEGRAARLLATSRDGKALQELRELYKALEGAAKKRDDGRSILARDLEFHEGLCRLSGNGRLAEVFARYVPMLRILLRVDELLFESPAAMAKDHLPLLEAIERGDVSRAESLAEEHCDRAADQISRYLDGLNP